MSITREQFVSAARAYLGAPYLHQGWSLGGMDCRGLLLAAARDCGLLSEQEIVSIPEMMNYSREPDGVTMAALLKRYCQYWPEGAKQDTGDILAIRYAEHPQHLMIVVEPSEQWGAKIIHSIEPYGVIEHRLDSTWLRSHRARVAGVFTIKGVE